VIGAEFEEGDPQTAKLVLLAYILVRRDQNVEPVPLGSLEQIAVAQLMPISKACLTSTPARTVRGPRPAPLLLQRGQSSGVAGAMFLTADDVTARDLGQCLVHVWLGPCEIGLLF
jgi:hypothetical protein